MRMQTITYLGFKMSKYSEEVDIIKIKGHENLVSLLQQKLRAANISELKVSTYQFPTGRQIIQKYGWNDE